MNSKFVIFISLLYSMKEKLSLLILKVMANVASYNIMTTRWFVIKTVLKLLFQKFCHISVPKLNFMRT